MKRLAIICAALALTVGAAQARHRTRHRVARAPAVVYKTIIIEVVPDDLSCVFSIDGAPLAPLDPRACLKPSEQP